MDTQRPKRMNARGTMLLSRGDISRLLGPGDYLQTVENAFRSYAQGKTLELGLLHADASKGEFHIKTGGIELERTYFGLKLNGGFFQNVAKFGIPNIQGTISLCDGETGYPLALMDSIEITVNRTGATTAVAAKYLAKADARIVTICGCGTQGRIQLHYITRVLSIEEAYAFDSDSEKSRRFAAEMSENLGIRIRAVEDLRSAVRRSDVCITCTPSRTYFLKQDYVPAGMFVAAVGADSPEKQEIDPRLMVSNTVVVDVLQQCVEVGELHHAIAAGLVSTKDVHAELGEVLIGERSGRTSNDEIIIFDATGTGLQDAAAAAAAYEGALSSGRGTHFDFFAR